MDCRMYVEAEVGKKVSICGFFPMLLYRCTSGEVILGARGRVDSKQCTSRLTAAVLA